MAKQKNDYLFKLIKSLTKAEKRHFKLYANRIGGSDDLKFITLFDIIDKMKEYDENEILKKAKTISQVQLPNMKANLTKNLLTSLQLMSRQTDIDIMLRQQLDFAKILYNKALYNNSLSVLNKAKQMAQKYNRSIIYLEMVENEKLIESQYITRSIDTRADELTEESDKISANLVLSSSMSNMAIRLYGFYLKNGYARNENDQIRITDYFHRYMPQFNFEDLGFYEKINLYQSHVWYYLLLQDFLMVFRYSLKWVELFKETPGAIESQTDLYIKGYDHLLDGLYFTGDYTRFEKALNEFDSFGKNLNVQWNKNTELLYYQHYYTHYINWVFMEGKFSESIQFAPKIIDFINTNSIYLDNHIVLVFYYKIACLYFGSADYKNCIKYLNMVINYKDIELRGDIQCFARILNLISHFEMENYDLIEYLVKTTYRFLAKMHDLHRAQKEMLLFLRRLPLISADKLTDEFRKLLQELKKLRNDPYEKRPFLYLDIISWLESKISGTPVQDIIRAKRLGVDNQ